MSPPPPSDPALLREELRAKVYTLLEKVLPDQRRQLEVLLTPQEPGLAKALEDLFQQTSTGRGEAARMEADVFRRISRSEETEQIFRPYGVLELVTPVIQGGRTVFGIRSGPLLVEAWSPAAKETLCKLCGIRTQQLPPELDSASVYTPAQIRALTGLQAQLAHWVSTAFQPSAPEEVTESSQPEPGALELLQPGFADHLDILFGLIQQATPKGRGVGPEEAARIHSIAERGRKLTEHARRLRDHSDANPRPLSVHAVLAGWCKKLESRFPHVRIRTRLEAEEEMVVASPQQLHHLVFTLLSGIVDGLPEGKALLGISTRNHQEEAGNFLHVEIRDGGGLATFAGVGGELDRTLNFEAEEWAEEGAEWTTLASKLKARIRILRDQDTVTRADIYLPLAGGTDGDVTATGAQHLWIVEDDDREAEQILRMVQTLSVSCTRFHSAAELKEKFATATSAPDIILLKYYLPDERGADVRSWLYEQDPSLPVILISSLDATHPGIATVNQLPSTLYLQKPFDASALVDMLHLNLDDTLG